MTSPIVAGLILLLGTMAYVGFKNSDRALISLLLIGAALIGMIAHG